MRTPTTDRREIERRKTCIFALRAEPGAEDHEEDHGDAGEEPAGAQHRERATRKSKTDRGARHYRMREDVADKAHPPQQKQRAEGTAGDRKCHASDQCGPHEGVFGEGSDEGGPETHVDQSPSGRHRQPQSRTGPSRRRGQAGLERDSPVSAPSPSRPRRSTCARARGSPERSRGPARGHAGQRSPCGPRHASVARASAGRRSWPRRRRRTARREGRSGASCTMTRANRARRNCPTESSPSMRPASASRPTACRAFMPRERSSGGTRPRAPILAQPPSAANSRTEIGKSRSMESLCGR